MADKLTKKEIDRILEFINSDQEEDLFYRHIKKHPSLPNSVEIFTIHHEGIYPVYEMLSNIQRYATEFKVDESELRKDLTILHTLLLIKQDILKGDCQSDTEKKSLFGVKDFANMLDVFKDTMKRCLKYKLEVFYPIITLLWSVETDIKGHLLDIKIDKAVGVEDFIKEHSSFDTTGIEDDFAKALKDPLNFKVYNNVELIDMVNAVLETYPTLRLKKHYTTYGSLKHVISSQLYIMYQLYRLRFVIAEIQRLEDKANNRRPLLVEYLKGFTCILKALDTYNEDILLTHISKSTNEIRIIVWLLEQLLEEPKKHKEKKVLTLHIALQSKNFNKIFVYNLDIDRFFRMFQHYIFMSC